MEEGSDDVTVQAVHVGLDFGASEDSEIRPLLL
jgi:hypothetical protein